MTVLRKAAVAAASFLMLTLSACTATQGGNVSDNPVDNTDSSATNDAPEKPTNPTFGQTYTWDDGTWITVSAPEPFVASFASEVPEGFTAVRLTVKVENHTGEAWNPSRMSRSYLSGGKAGDPMCLSDGIECLVSVDVPNGRSVEVVYGVAVADPNDVTMTIKLTWLGGHEVIFTS
ncbi:MAG: hypothetical protein LBJ44_08850 [Propionibacteriaceae bacterium]|jgi:hypothetical protein|nr:hypothetical protein [Propionibacteriaceae bacterium]